MTGFKFIFAIILILSFTRLLANGGFYEDTGNNQRQKVVFNFGGADEWKSVVADVEGVDYGTKSATDIWILKGGEGHVWKDNGSDITAVTLHYRIYKDGTSPPFIAINLPWASNIGGNNQRWASTAENIDIIAAVSSSGLWHVEFYYTAVTNGVDGILNPMYFNDGGNNYTLDFTADMTLPVSLSAFEGQSTDSYNSLEWTTSSEDNTDKFIIERSDNTKSWEAISDIAAEGFSTTNINYSYIDLNPILNAYYRLKIMDIDGIFSYSDVINIKRKNNITTVSNIYPNPFNDKIFVQIDNDSEKELEITIHDTFGKTIINKLMWSNIGQETISIDMPKLNTGSYLVSIKTNTSSITKKLIKL